MGDRGSTSWMFYDRRALTVLPEEGEFGISLTEFHLTDEQKVGTTGTAMGTNPRGGSFLYPITGAEQSFGGSLLASTSAGSLRRRPRVGFHRHRQKRPRA